MKKIFVLLTLTAGLLAACKKDENLTIPRLFRPVIAHELIVDSNTIVAFWQKIAGARSYLFQISRDTFKTIDLSVSLDTNMVIVKKLLFNQLYQVQVKAVASDTAMSSKWSYLGAIKTLSSILKVPAPDDISFNSVRVRWTTKGAPVTGIGILKTSDSSVVTKVDLTATDVTNEFKVIDGLQPDTKYTIFLLSGTEVRGHVDFITKEPFAGTVVDLTGITGKPSVLADTIPDIPSGSTVLLKRGETYNISSAISLGKSLVIMSVPDLGNTVQARIYFTSNFNFAAGSTIDSVEFNDLYMVSDNYTSRYVINNSNSTNIGKIKFMNSRVEIFRGMVRLQAGTTTVNNFVINNCIIDSIGNYFVLNIGATTCRIDNVSIQNSTIYKVEGVVASAQTSTAVLVDNCTFNEAPLGNNKNYYIDYGANAVSNGISVSNCIFGIGKNSANAFTVKDVRAAASTAINAPNNYRTSDHLSGGNDFPNITTYTRPASQLWQDPANGIFKIIDNTYPGRNSTGDPRWR
jgi:hypothetical protein